MSRRTVMETRVEKIHAFIQEKGLDGVLLRKRRNFSWLSGGGHAHIVLSSEMAVADLLILPDQVYAVTSQMEARRIQEEELAELDCTWVTPEWIDGTESSLQELCGDKRIGCDVIPSTVGLANGIDLTTEIAELTYVLDNGDQARYRALAQDAAKALEKTCREIQPGMTEYEMQALLAANVIKSELVPHVMLIATDERIFQYRHPIPTSKKLERYAMVVLCAERGGLIANATRFVHFGELPDQLKENRVKLAQIDLAMNLATRPGVAIKDVFARGMEAYKEVGYPDDWRFLHQGGPTGYATREFIVTPTSPGVVQLGQAFAWNPAIRGVKSEDTILVGPEENEFLTHTGEWTYLSVKSGERTYLRPDILIR